MMSIARFLGIGLWLNTVRQYCYTGEMGSLIDDAPWYYDHVSNAYCRMRLSHST